MQSRTDRVQHPLVPRIVPSRGHRHQHPDSDSPTLPELHHVVGGLGCWPIHFLPLRYSAYNLRRPPSRLGNTVQIEYLSSKACDGQRHLRSLNPSPIACTSKSKQRSKQVQQSFARTQYQCSTPSMDSVTSLSEPISSISSPPSQDPMGK
jgi:hypothetical protein